jgi:hypothetical protein
MKTLLTAIVLCLCAAAIAEDQTFERFTTAWRDDPVWFDGRAECAVYEATRVIYGQPRQYLARIYTNKEHASPDTFTKSATGHGRAVFKQHLREDIATENYTYHYSTMCYVGTSDLKSLKLDFGSQEDCGASFKQYINHAGTLTWQQFTYFPDEGHRSGAYAPPGDFVFFNALPLLLRGYPFMNPSDEPLQLMVLPDQISTHLTETMPGAVSTVVFYMGLETLDLPIGKIESHRLAVRPNRRMREGDQIMPVHYYWFAVDPAQQHILVQYQSPVGPDTLGTRYQLKSVERRAYWLRN